MSSALRRLARSFYIDKERLMAEEENKIILYTTEDGKSQVSLMSRDGRVWLNQKQMAELLG